MPVESGFRNRLKLAGCLLGLVFVWLLVLPRLEHLPMVETRIQRNEAMGIDPEATFYSELELMQPTIQQMNELHRTHPDAFWRWGAHSDSRSETR